MNTCEALVELIDGTYVPYESVESEARGKQLQRALKQLGLAGANSITGRLRWTCLCTGRGHATAGWDLHHPDVEQSPQHFVLVHLEHMVEVMHQGCFISWGRRKGGASGGPIAGLWSPHVEAIRNGVHV